MPGTVEERELVDRGLPGGHVEVDGLVECFYALDRHGRTSRGPLESVEVAGTAVDDAEQVSGVADRPGEGGRQQVEGGLEVVEQLQRLDAGAVALIDEGDQGDAAAPGDLEEPEGLALDACCGVDQDDGAVDRRHHPQRVFAEIAVARGVEQVDDDVVVLEAEHGRGDRDAAALLEVHPVRGGGLALAAAFDGTGLVDRLAVEQQLFGHGRLAGVRVGDDREGPAAPGLADDRSVLHGGGFRSGCCRFWRHDPSGYRYLITFPAWRSWFRPASGR